MIAGALADDQILISIVALLSVLVMDLPTLGERLADRVFSDSNMKTTIAADGATGIRLLVTVPVAPRRETLA